MKNYVKDGATRTWTNSTGSAVVSGQVVKVGQQLGVATVDIANTASGEVAFEGEFTGPKVSAAVVAPGEMLLWDVSANSGAGAFDDNLATPATGDVSNAAVCTVAAGNGDTTVRFHLRNRIGTVA